MKPYDKALIVENRPGEVLTQMRNKNRLVSDNKEAKHLKKDFQALQRGNSRSGPEKKKTKLKKKHDTSVQSN